MATLLGIIANLINVGADFVELKFNGKKRGVDLIESASIGSRKGVSDSFGMLTVRNGGSIIYWPNCL